MRGLVRRNAWLTALLISAFLCWGLAYHSPVTADGTSKQAQKKKATKKKGKAERGNPAADQADGAGGTGGVVGPGGAGAAGGTGQQSGAATIRIAPGNGANVAEDPTGKNNPGPAQEIVKKVMGVQNKHSKDLMNQEGIVGTVTGLSEEGNVIIKIYTSGAGEPKIPKQLDGVQVEEVLTGPWHPQAAPFNPKARQPRPVPIGVSTTSENGGCWDPAISAGTIGCRLKASDGSVYALSNNHVVANENAGQPGDLVIQPGSLDEFFNGNTVCAPADVIGTLFKFKPIEVAVGSTNLFDAAIVKTDRTMVGKSTAPEPDGYGTPRTAVFLSPYLGQAVQKCGRTTGHTTGTVTGLNQMVVVGYTPGLATFVRQIEITGDNSRPFNLQGDSGSLIVTMDRFPVALLFASAGIRTSGGPIQPVLDYFGMTIDGDATPVSPLPGKVGRSTPNSP